MRSAIARAAQRTGVDFDYLLAQARIESSLDPGAKARTSSAAGLYQFTRDTWLRTLDRHGAAHGLGWAGDAIEGGKVDDPGMRAQILALRYDADASALMAAELARDNRDELFASLGREPDVAELYLGHFLGAGGASRFLSALGATPNASAAALLPAAASANRAIFYAEDGAPRSLASVMGLVRARIDGAMEGDGQSWAVVDSTSEAAPPMGPIAREFHAARAELPQMQERRSMADTLLATFGTHAGNGEIAASDSVRAAYGRLRGFGL